MDTNDPMLAAGREVLKFAIAEIRGSIEGASAEALNWRPGDDETNSIAVLAVHAMSSTRSGLSVALGATLPLRDRDAEFTVTAGDAGGALARFDELATECRALIETSATVDWAAMRATHPRPRADAPSQVPAAWAFIHALEHLREHEGQMFLTRQLWDQRVGT